MIQIPLNSTLNSNSFPPLKPNVRYRTAMERAGFDVVSPTSPSGSQAPSIRGPSSGSVPGSRVVSRGSYASGAGKKVMNRAGKAPFHPYAAQQVHSKSVDSVYKKAPAPGPGHNVSVPGTGPGKGPGIVSGTAPVPAPVHHYRQMSPGSLSVDQAFHRLNGENTDTQEQAFDKISFDFEHRGDDEKPASHDFPVPASMSSPNLNSNSSSTYNTPQVGTGASGGGLFMPIDPVEQSFQQLTNETRGESRGGQKDLDEQEDDYVPDLAPKNELQGLQNGLGLGSQPQSQPQPQPKVESQPQPQSPAQDDSISFEPNEALNKVLESAPQTIPGIFVTQEPPERSLEQASRPESRPDSRPESRPESGPESRPESQPEEAQSGFEHSDELSDSELQLEPEPGLQLGLKSEWSETLHGDPQGEPQGERAASPPVAARSTSPLPHSTITHVPHLPEHEGKLTAMEKLIAELDTVTLAREEEQQDLMGLDVPQKANKKSSAYLSRYEPQRIIIPDSPVRAPSQGLSQGSNSGNSHLSMQSNSTPTFYKFRKDLGPLQVEKEELQELEEHEQAHEQAQEHEQEPLPVSGPTPFKFPPGQGPCRHCNKEVLQKGIYSKHENELSGQWHRGCFKCIECEKPFSKRVPCYILDDQPYCQLHFHQANNSICKVCDGFIEGECLENDKNERYHPSCLKCYICDHLITTDYYVYNHKHTICHNHDLAELHRSPNLRDLGRSNTLSKRRTRLINFG